jgi:hypothetical protein
MLVVAIMEDTDGRDCSLLLTVRKLRKFSFPFCISENSEKAYVLSLFSLSLSLSLSLSHFYFFSYFLSITLAAQKTLVRVVTSYLALEATCERRC